MDGSLPGKNFGSAFYVTLAPLAKRPLPEFGRKSDGERQLLRSLQGQLDVMRRSVARASEGRIGSDAPLWLTLKQENALRWLLSGAQAALDRIPEIYAQWDTRDLGSYPLELPDTAAGFNAACAGKEAYSKIVIGGGRGLEVSCPGATTYEARRADRAAIRSLTVDAMHHLRCAQYRYQRLRLYALALEAYEPPPGAGFGMAAPTGQPWVGPQPQVAYVSPGALDPPGPPGGFAPTPPDVPEVDPETLPDPDSAGVPGPPDQGPGFVDRVAAIPTWKKVAAGTGLVVLLGVLLSD